MEENEGRETGIKGDYKPWGLSIRKDEADITELGEEKVWWRRGKNGSQVRDLQNLKAY